MSETTDVIRDVVAPAYHTVLAGAVDRTATRIREQIGERDFVLADEAKRNLALFGQGYMQTPDFGQIGREAPIGARREKVAEAMYALITSLADVGARIGAPSSAGVR